MPSNRGGGSLDACRQLFQLLIPCPEEDRLTLLRPVRVLCHGANAISTPGFACSMSLPRALPFLWHEEASKHTFKTFSIPVTRNSPSWGVTERSGLTTTAEHYLQKLRNETYVNEPCTFSSKERSTKVAELDQTGQFWDHLPALSQGRLLCCFWFLQQATIQERKTFWKPPLAQSFAKKKVVR